MAHIKDWDEKTSVLARASVHQNLRLIAGIPSWLRIFFQKLQKQACGQNPRLAEVYPGLEMVVHGGVNFAPYRRQFEAYLEGSHAELREVYPASEGFLAAADRSSGQGLRLMLQHGIFFEFVPLDELDSTRPTRHWIANLEKDLNYAVVLTTCAGLWSYVIGDTVRFVNLSPPGVLITGRTSYMLSAFGEHLIGEEIEDAVSEAAASCGCLVADFSVGARYPDEGNERGGHLYIMEFLQNGLSQDVIRKMAEVIDRRLIERNADYAAHRSEGLGMDAPQTIVAGRGCFAAWMKSRGKLGGQNKVPRIINDPDLFASLISFVDQFNKQEPS